MASTTAVNGSGRKARAAAPVMTPEAKSEAAVTMRTASSAKERKLAAAHLGETGAAKPRGRRKKVVEDMAPLSHESHEEHSDMPEEHHDEGEMS
jgi:hypothetical protein